MSNQASADLELDPRQRQLLEAAVRVFMRYGYRKTSMDEVARAAGLSRQGLYLHFATKEQLFAAALKHVFECSLADAQAQLDAADLSFEARLAGAFDAWVGRYVGIAGDSAADLAEASRTVGGNVGQEYEVRFAESLARAFRGSGLMAAYRPANINARQLADTLTATARGLKYSSQTREAFREAMTIAVRALCLPLRGAP